LDRPKLPEAATLLLVDARHQVSLIRQSIADRTRYRFGGGEDLREGDVATSIAEDITGVMREYDTDPQTLFQALSEQLPEANFTVDWYDAATLTAAEIRLQRIHGMIEGLKLAGLMPEPS
jgi:hypothetical protein